MSNNILIVIGNDGIKAVGSPVDAEAYCSIGDIYGKMIIGKPIVIGIQNYILALPFFWFCTIRRLRRQRVIRPVMTGVTTHELLFYIRI